MSLYIHKYKYISFTKYKHKTLLVYMYVSKHRVKFISCMVFILTVAFWFFDILSLV